MEEGIKIPDNIIVGYNDNKTLSFVTYEEEGKLRQPKAFEGWNGYGLHAYPKLKEMFFKYYNLSSIKPENYYYINVMIVYILKEVFFSFSR